MSARIALCPGSFDPVTLGHEDVVRRALALADRVIVAVGYSPQQTKQGMFGVDERVALIREVFAGEPRVQADAFQGLLVDYARKTGAALVVKGLRTVADFEYEMQMALMNRAQHPGLDTVFLAPEPAHSFVSGTLVRQIATLGGDVSPFVSPAVLTRIEQKLRPEQPVVRKRSVTVAQLREAVRAQVAATAIRHVAHEIGMSPVGVKRFIDGAEPAARTREMLEAWWSERPESRGR